MAKYYTYDQVGLVEDVSNVISNIAPTETPFTSSIKEEGVDQTLFEWQEDSLDAPADNDQIEGADAPAASHTPTVMRSNRTQILSKTVEITGTNERVKKYGRKSELAYQLAKKGKEIKRDLERAFVGRVQAAVVGSSSVARRMASYDQMIDAANVNDNGNVNRNLSETIVLDVMKKVYNSGGEASILMIKPADAGLVAEFASSAAAAALGRMRDVGSAKKVVNAVQIYVSPWGEVKVVMNRFQVAEHALFYDPSFWARCKLRPFSREKLAKTGDAEKHQLLGEYSLKHKNFAASGIAKDLS